MARRFCDTAAQQRALKTYVKLLRAANTVSAAATRHLASAPLTLSQFAVLEALYHAGPLVLCDLARKVLSSSGNLTLVVDNLEKRGLARRTQRQRDRRFITVEITARGSKLMSRIFPDHAQRIATAMAALTAAEQEQLAALCRKLGLGEGTKK